MLYNSRAILALNGTLMTILGGAFWLFPDFFTLSMFPDFAENQQAIDVGVALRKNMGAGCAFIGIILFSCQTSSKSTAQRLLFSSAIGFLLMVTALLQVKLSGQADVPVFIVVFFFSFVCFVTLCGIAAVPRITDRETLNYVQDHLGVVGGVWRVLCFRNG